MKFETEIYETKEQPYFVIRNIVGFILFGTTLILILLMFINEFFNNPVTIFLLFTSLFGYLILGLTQFRINKIPSKCLGQLEIDGQAIKIINEEYNIESIESITFRFNDYRGKTIYRNRLDFRGYYSEGLNNYLDFSTKEGQKVTIQFKLKHKNHSKDLKEFYVNAIERKLIPLKNSYHILGLRNYAEIQEFKKKITSHNNG